MRHHFFSATLGLLLGSVAMPAWAGFGSEAAWDDIVARAAGFGVSLEATSEMTGDTLRLAPVAVILDTGDRISIPQISLRDVGAGAVILEIPGRQELTVNDGEEDVRGVLAQEGLRVLLTGEDDRILEIMAEADSVLFEVDGTDGEARGSARLDLDGLRLVWADGRLDMVLGQFQAAGGGADPGGFNALSLAGDIALDGLRLGFERLEPVHPMVPFPGFRLTSSWQEIRQDIRTDVGGDAAASGTSSSVSGAGEIRASFDGDGFHVHAAGSGGTTRMRGYDAPDLDLDFGGSLLEIRVPVRASDMPQAFGLAFQASDIRPDAASWARLDPSGELSRDPLGIDVRLNGEVTLLHDIFDDVVQRGIEAPFQELSARLEALWSGFGSSITGSGRLDVRSMTPVPDADGILEVVFERVPQMLDALSASGILDAGIADGMRFPLMMFTQPGDTADQVVTRVELTPEGALLLNGQRMQ